MSVKLVHFLLCLQSLVLYTDSSYDLDLLSKVISHNRQYYNATNYPLFLGNDVSHNELDTLENLIKELPETVAKYNFYQNADDNPYNILRNYVGVDTLSIVFCASSEDRIWNIVNNRLRKLRISRVIVVLEQSKTENPRQLEMVLEKLWSLQFLNVVVLYHKKVYSYKPYPKLSIYELNINKTALDLFPPKRKNLQGYNISTPVENDIPRIFCIKDTEGRTQIKGFAYQIFNHFIKRLNATLHIPNLNASRSIASSVNMSNILRRISKLELEISLHPYTSIEETEGVLGYPVFKLENCLIVPVQNEIERWMYIVRPFTWESWLLIFVGVVYVAIILSFVNPTLKQLRPLHVRLSRSLLEALSQIFALSSILSIYNPKWIYFLVSLLLGMLGFFITNCYCDLLSSFLTTFLVGEQVDTFEQAIATRLPVMVKSYEASMVLQQVPPHLVNAFQRLLVPVNASVQVAHLLSFNRSYSYPVTQERWTFLARQQEYANKPLCRYSNICFGAPKIGYPMRLDSHLEDFMTQFIMDVQMSGLDHYWLTSDFEYALKAGYVRWIDNVLPFKALDLDSLRVAWIILITGWIIATFGFLFEYFLKR